MTVPPELARDPRIDAAARAVLEALAAVDLPTALACLERMHSEAAAGAARRAILAARVALLRGAKVLPPLPIAPPVVEAAPEPPPPPPPPPPKPLVIPTLDLSAMMSLLDEFDVPEAPAPTPAPAPSPEPEPAVPAEGGWTRVRLTEDGPRGPGHFPKGAALSVTLEDAARLLMAGIAEELEPGADGTPGAEDGLDAGDDEAPRLRANGTSPDFGVPDATAAAAKAPFVVTFPDEGEEADDWFAQSRPPAPSFRVDFPQDDAGPSADPAGPASARSFKVVFPDDGAEPAAEPAAPASAKPFRVVFPEGFGEPAQEAETEAAEPVTPAPKTRKPRTRRPKKPATPDGSGV
ncbi:hypothetical protein [Rhodobacter sp. CZR27]|uniref:hypothetical protein n=1 Tax=Rhodobacter sp. CZR27 TaxID=2033869 RepID=UPI000BBE190F|nr:hypothetical protein [Rhodobacter sp. CZR27]